ncbi:MAG: phage tail tube protein [Candidatus Falkowbacteria bacterium]
MMELIKRRFNIGIGRETSRGVAVAPSYWLKPLSEDINDKIEVAVSERAVGVIEDSEDQEISKKMSGGGIAGEVFDESFGLILLATLGQVGSLETADAGVFDHVFAVLQSAKHPTLTVEVKRGDNGQKAYPNAVIETLKLEAAAGQYLKYEIAVRGKAGVAATSVPAYTAENYFLGQHISLKLADDLAGLDGASAIDVKKVEININKNIEDDDKLGSVEPNDFLNKQLTIEGSVEMNFKDTVLLDYALNGNKKALRLEIVNGDVTIGASSHPKLTIDLAKIKLREPLVSGDNNEIAKVTAAFKAFYSASDSKSIEAKLTNLAAVY